MIESAPSLEIEQLWEHENTLGYSLVDQGMIPDKHIDTYVFSCKAPYAVTLIGAVNSIRGLCTADNVAIILNASL